MRALINRQAVTVRVVGRKDGIFGKRVLVEYSVNYRDDDGKIKYTTTNNVKWIPESNLIPEEEV